MNVDDMHRAEGHRLLAACWTWAGDAAPGRPGPAEIDALLDRVRAAAAAGWDGLGFHEADLGTVRDTIGLTHLGEMLSEARIGLVEVEFLDGWWRPDRDRTAESLSLETALLEAASALEARLIKAGAPTQEELSDLGPDRVAARLAALGGRAEQAGTRVGVEAMGVPGALTIHEVVDLVARADSSSCGAVVDNFQLAARGTSREELVALDWEHVVSIELGDGIVEAGQLAERCLPGEGDLDLPAFVRDVSALGWTGCWGVEIISSQLRRLPQSEGVRRVREGILEVFARAERQGSRSAR